MNRSSAEFERSKSRKRQGRGVTQYSTEAILR